MKKTLKVVVMLILVGCAPQNQEIPVLIYDLKDAYIDDYQRRMMDVGIDGADLKVYDGQHSQTIQNEQIDDLLGKDMPLLLVNPVDRLSVHAIIEKAKQQEKAIIFFNREPL